MFINGSVDASRLLLAYRYKKKDCYPPLSVYNPYRLAAVINRDRGQEGLWAKHSIGYRVNKGLVYVHNDPYSDIFKLGSNVHVCVWWCLEEITSQQIVIYVVTFP